MYEMDLVFRNNRTSEEYPLWYSSIHIKTYIILKKENIGLIEVMGLAVLPARLKDELEVFKRMFIRKKEYFRNFQI